MKEGTVRTIVYNKLIRDNVPEVTVEHGGKPTTRVLDKKEFEDALLTKLIEEAIEAQEAHTTKDKHSELADILEVIRTMADADGITMDDLEKIREQKAQDKGVFAKHLFLISVDEVD